MNRMTMHCYAKINWTLDVLARRDDGYHQVDLLLQNISLSDRVELSLSKGISLTCDHRDVPSGPENIAWRAAAMLARLAPGHGCRIRIEKRIPLAAGLAGGSANAAAVLWGLNELWALRLPLARLSELAYALGSDVPFCLMGGCARGEDRGQLLTPLSSSVFHLVVINPGYGVSSAEAYGRLNLDAMPLRPHTHRAIEALAQGDAEDLSHAMANVLQPAVFALHPDLEPLCQALIKHGALAAQMSGSGPTVFGLFADERTAQNAAGRLSHLTGHFVKYARSVGHSLDTTAGP